MNSKRFLIIITVALAVLSVLLIRSVFYYQDQVDSKRESTLTDSQTSEDTYLFKNEEFGYSIVHPLHLAPRQIDVEGSSYESFVKFEPIEEGFTDSFSIGVRDTSLEEEIKLVTDEMTSGSVEANLTNQEMLLSEEVKIYRMDFAPADSTGGEERSLLLIDSGEFTYSLSSNPDHLLEAFSGFDLLDN
ncbi:MAG: hypothetical protein PVJ52_02515 [Candidatus Woesebacteria bacterium]|jgi:hypothetical protein